MEKFAVDIAVLRVVNRTLRVIAFDVAAQDFSLRQLEGEDLLVKLFEGFEDQSEIDLEKVKMFADRELYRDALGSSINQIQTSKEELHKLGFVQFAPLEWK